MFRTVARMFLKLWPLVLALTLVGGLALASIPDSNGIIHGCYKISGGAVRVIDTAKNQKCISTEKPLTWNQKGRQGLPGASGTNGANGTTIIARVRLSQPFTPNPPDTQQVIPGASVSWTQGADEVDQLLPGTMSVSMPNECVVAGSAINVSATLFLPLADGAQPGGWSTGTDVMVFDHSVASQDAVLPLFLDGSSSNYGDITVLVEPGSPTIRTITPQAYAYCTPPGSSTRYGVTLTGISIDVVAMR